MDGDTDHTDGSAVIDINSTPKELLPPSEIQKIVRSGNASNVFAVGNLFPLRLDGTVGICDVTGDWYSCIIGIDHNKELEGNNTVHFQFPYTVDGKGLAFVDENYENYGNYQTIGFIINPKGDSRYTGEPYVFGFNDGGWKSSYARNTLMPQFLNAMLLIWRSIITKISKWHDNVGNGIFSALNVTQSSSDIWYLAEFEVYGKRFCANESEQSYQEQYSYYGNGGSKQRFKHNVVTTCSVWWLASVCAYSIANNKQVNVCYVLPSGSNSYGAAGCSYGVAPAFAVA